MARSGYAVLALIAGLVVGAPAEAEAQAADGWWEWALRDLATDARDRDRSDRTIGDIILGRDGDRDRDERADRRDRKDRESARERGKQKNKAGKGPPFCRNGEGHPVHGRQWCRDKGFGLGSGLGGRWEDRGSWGDIILGSPRGGDRRRGAVDRGGLIDVLGDVVFGRIDAERARVGGRAPLEGRWLELGDGGHVLQIRSGSRPVAELTDLNGDGRVDVALVPRR